jgi:hypothetical protein
MNQTMSQTFRESRPFYGPFLIWVFMNVVEKTKVVSPIAKFVTTTACLIFSYNIRCAMSARITLTNLGTNGNFLCKIS